MAEREALVAALAASPDLLAQAVAGMPDERWDQRVDGGWTARQVLGHLVDSEVVFAWRLRMALGDSGSAIAPYDQDAWAAGISYAGIGPEQLSATFASLRWLTVAMLAGLDDAAWSRTILHPELGEQDVRRVVEVFGAHSREHTAELAAIATRG